jgi:hypothetical protein
MRFLAINISDNVSGPKTPIRLLLISILLAGSSLPAFGQTLKPDGIQKTSPRIPATQVNSLPTRTNVDETFELNIDERHYSQENFEASTAVGTKKATDDLNLQVGVALTSGRIDVLLRNVHGRVRFRGTLDRIMELINNRQAAPGALPTSSGAVPPPSP